MRSSILFVGMMLSLCLQGQIHFANRALLAGVNHSYPVHMGGGGVSFVDFDGDGWDDLTLGTGPDESMHFYRNLGGQFEKLDLIQTDMLVKSVLWVDYDNDGRKDLFAVGFDSHNRLFRNTGDLQLTEVTEAAGLPTGNKRCFGASFADVNRDGWLDLYYAERKLPEEMVENQMRLFINNADGTFSDETAAWAAADMGKTPFCATFFDCNRDKWPDVYIANDKLTINTLLENTGQGFIDKSEASTTDLAMNAMCVAIADVDKNGFTDIYVTNTEEGSALLMNDDGYHFTASSGAYEVTFAGGIGWGSNLFDADNDGWTDLYVSGMIEGADALSSAFYRNLGGELFERPEAGFVGDTVVSFNNAIGDYNQDGLPDIAVINWTPAQAQLWSNQSTSANTWLKVDLEGVYSNKDGIGAEICVYTPDDENQCQYTTCGIGFLGQNSEQIHFGLGNNQSVDSIAVLWPTGHKDVLIDPSLHMLHKIKEGSTTNGDIHIDEDINVISSINTPILINQNQLDIFPNPSAQYLQFDQIEKFTGKNYRIMNALGKTERQGWIQNEFINIAGLPAGSHFLYINNKENSWIARFIKI